MGMVLPKYAADSFTQGLLQPPEPAQPPAMKNRKTTRDIDDYVNGTGQQQANDAAPDIMSSQENVDALSGAAQSAAAGPVGPSAGSAEDLYDNQPVQEGHSQRRSQLPQKLRKARANQIIPMSPEYKPSTMRSSQPHGADAM